MQKANLQKRIVCQLSCNGVLVLVTRINATPMTQGGPAGSFGGLAASNAQEKRSLAEAITVSQQADQGHTSGFEVRCTVEEISWRQISCCMMSFSDQLTRVSLSQLISFLLVLRESRHTV